MELDLEMAARWLRLVCPPDTPGLAIISSHSDWAGTRIEPGGDISRALHNIKARNGDSGVYLRMGTIDPSAPPRSRGALEDTVSVFGLWADIDVDGPGHKHDPSRHEGRLLPPDRLAGRDLVRHLPEPTAWVDSGGGLYPLWLPERPWLIQDVPGLGELSVDLQYSILGAATARGWHYGTGVGDLARVLRIPGTINRKPGQLSQCLLLSWQGPRYTYEQLRAAVPGRPVSTPVNRPDPTPTVMPLRSRFQAPATGGTFEDSPLELYAQQTDFDTLLRGDGWTFVRETAGRRHYTRPGKKATEGVSGNLVVEGGREVFYCFSESAGLPTRVAMSAGQWYAWRFHGGDLRQATRDLRQAGYGAPRAYPASTGTNGHAPILADTPKHLPVPVRVAAEDVWFRRPILRAIHAIAKQQMVGPWAVLGCVLAHVACRLGPHIVLPAIVGSKASLNLFVGLVGPSGAGKDAAIAVAEELLKTGQTPRRKLGTGQGIDAMFSKQHPKLGPIQFSDVALIIAPEIDTVDAHSRMNGSTLMSTLREVYSGSDLGAHYADQHKRRPVKKHAYRAAVIAGVQPARSSVLLGDADGGTPQRWLWLPTNMPDDGGPKIVPPLDATWWQDYENLIPMGEVDGDEGVHRKEEMVIDVCSQAAYEVRAARAKRLRMGLTEQSDDMAGHLLLTRLKVAALFGFMDKRSNVSEDDWALAGQIIGKSEETRAICQNVLAEKSTQNARSRGKADAVRQQATEELLDADGVARACRSILTKLGKAEGGALTRTQLRGSMDSKLKIHFDAAYELLSNTGQVHEQERENAQGRLSLWYYLAGRPKK